MAKNLVAALALLACSACTSLQPLPDTQPATIRQSVQPGDRVEVVRTDGMTLDLKVEQVTDAAIVGYAGTQSHTVPLAEIRSIGKRAMTTRDKVLTGVGAAIAVGVVIAIAADGGDDDGGGSGGSSSGY